MEIRFSPFAVCAIFIFYLVDFLCFVRMKGLEPLLLSKLDPKSSASTNSATPAYSLIFEGAKIQ